MSPCPVILFNNSYAQLPSVFYSQQLPTPVSAPALIKVNSVLAALLGINAEQLASDEGVKVLAGNTIADGSQPIATVYAAHQFGGWNPRLGDGRAILLGEVIGNDGQRYDIQLKGSGKTPYSRSGDGRSPLGPVLREYIVSEAMAAFGVPTTRSLAAVSSGDVVVRNGYLPGAILTRVAKSHIRVGTFQYFAAQQDTAPVKVLADYVIARHYPHAAYAENPYASLLIAVIEAQAQLIARWMSLGFIHGVMNTDNMLVCGETVDYGPCAFMDEFAMGKVFSSIDQHGRYAYANQPAIAHWNLACLAQSLLPLLDSDEDVALKIAQDALNRFATVYQLSYNQHMATKLGFAAASQDSEQLVAELLSVMAAEKMDFSLTFRALTERLVAQVEATENWLDVIFVLPPTLIEWLQRWDTYRNSVMSTAQSAQLMGNNNPVVIPRNHQIERAIDEATLGNFSRFHALVAALAQPFTRNAEYLDFVYPPQPAERVTQTFCGT